MRTRLRALSALATTTRGCISPPIFTSQSAPSSLPLDSGCSRWFSCSRCRIQARKPDEAFFSTSRLARTASASIEEAATPTTYVLDHTSRSRSSRINHLPFPPPLPYSPDSLPFKRQLEILSLYISGGSPDDSWDSFQGIHRDLQRYIPDRLFRLLIAQQLANENVDDRWQRSYNLIRFAQGCGMHLQDLGREVLEMALMEGVRRTQDPAFRSKGRYHCLLRDLWQALAEVVKHQLSLLSLQTRQTWLQLHLDRCKKSSTHSSDRETRLLGARALVDELIRDGGGAGIADLAGRIISNEKTESEAVQLAALRQIVDCWVCGVETTSTATISIMKRLHLLWRKDGLDGTSQLRQNVLRILQEVGPDGSGRLADHLDECIGHVAGNAYRSQTERAVDLLALDDAKVPALIRQGLRLLRRRDQDRSLDMAITTLERALRRRDADCNALVSRLLTSLSPSHGKAGDGTRIARLTDTLLDSNSLQSVDPVLVQILFNLILSIDLTEERYILARKVYPFVRDTHSSLTWSHSNLHSWRTLFHYTLHPDRRHLHFASRLYADLLADGISIRRTDAIAMIRAVGTANGASRRILLDRHVKDYLHMGYGSRQAFLDAIVKGLTTGRKNDSYLLAFNLIMRLSTDKPVPLPVASMLLTGIPASSDDLDHRYFFDLLHALPAGDETAAMYDTAITTLIKSSVSRGQLSPAEALVRAVDLYKDMISRHIPPTAMTVSLIIQGLTRANFIDSALKVFHSSMDLNLAVRLSAAGRLVLALYEADRVTDADGVKRRCGEVVPEDAMLNHRFFSATRVLYDQQRGIEVDLKKVANAGGFRSTKSLRNHLEKLHPLLKRDVPDRPSSSTPIGSTVDSEALPIASDALTRDEARNTTSPPLQPSMSVVNTKPSSTETRRRSSINSIPSGVEVLPITASAPTRDPPRDKTGGPTQAGSGGGILKPVSKGTRPNLRSVGKARKDAGIVSGWLARGQWKKPLEDDEDVEAGVRLARTGS